jgi:ATP-dependent DNA helicase RecQ
MSAIAPDLTTELGRLFGYDEFRPGQREAIEGTLSGRDVLALMPTGSGKSLCYQLPALIGEGLTLVVSPLIALMQDQSAALRAAGHEGVEMIASIMSGEEVAACLRRIADRRARLVYVAPERFSSRRFLDAIGAAGVDRLAIDEAHCLSEWGHDFRPDFLRLADVRRRLGSPPTMALTATATPRVARDIVSALGLQDPVMARTGFDRPNLFFEVLHVAGEAGKPRMLLAHLKDPSRLPAVVYCGRRKTCEEVAAHLLGAGISAAPYHAGLEGEERTTTLEDFLAGKLQAVAATTAFGMGIDKADVRSVVHWTIPASPEEYYQQAGRAGRDGAPAVCTLLYCGADKGAREHSSCSPPGPARSPGGSPRRRSTVRTAVRRWSPCGSRSACAGTASRRSTATHPAIAAGAPSCSGTSATSPRRDRTSSAATTTAPAPRPPSRWTSGRRSCARSTRRAARWDARG